MSARPDLFGALTVLVGVAIAADHAGVLALAVLRGPLQRASAAAARDLAADATHDLDVLIVQGSAESIARRLEGARDAARAEALLRGVAAALGGGA